VALTAGSLPATVAARTAAQLLRMGEALTDVRHRHMVADLTVGLRLRVHTGEAARCLLMAEASVVAGLRLLPTDEVEEERRHTVAVAVTSADSVEVAVMPRLAEAAATAAEVVVIAVAEVTADTKLRS
jgi:hypothetical protein